MWGQSPLGVADGLCWAPKSLFWFCECGFGAVPFSSGLCAPPATGTGGSMPRAPGLALSPPSAQVLSAGAGGAGSGVITGDPPLPPGSQGSKGHPSPVQLEISPAPWQGASSVTPLVFKELGLKKMSFFGAGPTVPDCIRSALMPCAPAVCWDGAGASLVQWGQ